MRAPCSRVRAPTIRVPAREMGLGLDDWVLSGL